MAQERFLIVAIREPDDCFARFSESANRARIAAGRTDDSDPYAWIEATYSLQLRRWREATHLCSFTPSAYFIWLENVFVGDPNAAWEADPDPLGLEYESGGDRCGYGIYHDDYPRDFVCDSIVIDTVRDLGIRKPNVSDSPLLRSDAESERLETYNRAIWRHAEEIAIDLRGNGLWCPALNVAAFRGRNPHLYRAAA